MQSSPSSTVKDNTLGDIPVKQQPYNYLIIMSIMQSPSSHKETL